MFLYGPVLSRRLGHSLGVDIVTGKCCSFDCVYCQLGRSEACKPERIRFFDPEDIENALVKRLNEIDRLDYVTFAGSGEPTLSKDLGRFIDYLKESFPQYQTAVLTNSTLLHRDDVISDLKNADLLVPSLDASNPEQLQKINRPHKDIEFDQIIDGLVKLRDNFDGEIRLEIMLIKGINDDVVSLKRFAELVKKIAPDSIDINTPVRPPAESWVKVPESDNVERARDILNAEIITRKAGESQKYLDKGIDELSNYILSLLERRPETREALAGVVDLPIEVIDENLVKLIALDKIYKKITDSGVYYLAK